MTRRTTELPKSAMYKFPDWSRAIPVGELSIASAAGPPSPVYPGTPVPTTVVIDVVRRNLADPIVPLIRNKEVAQSVHRYIRRDRSQPMSQARLSPEKDGLPFPAMVLIMPWVSILRTRWLPRSAK